MNWFRERSWLSWPSMPAEELRLLRTALAVHATSATHGVCRVCRTARCPDWSNAYDQLAVAGQTMAEPGWWLGEQSKR